MTGEEIAGLIVGELTMNVSMSDANAAVLHDAICAAIDKERAHVAALEEENAKLKASRRVPELDNHHNALVCGYCSGPLRTLVGRLEGALTHLVKRDHGMHHGTPYRECREGFCGDPAGARRLLAEIADLDATR